MRRYLVDLVDLSREARLTEAQAEAVALYAAAKRLTFVLDGVLLATGFLLGCRGRRPKPDPVLEGPDLVAEPGAEAAVAPDPSPPGPEPAAADLPWPEHQGETVWPSDA